MKKHEEDILYWSLIIGSALYFATIIILGIHQAGAQ